MALTWAQVGALNTANADNPFIRAQESVATGTCTIGATTDYGTGATKGIPLTGWLSLIGHGLTPTNMVLCQVAYHYKSDNTIVPLVWLYDYQRVTLRAYKPDVGGGLVEITPASDLAAGDILGLVAICDLV